MRYCPTCLTRYADPTLRFCLEDGRPLLAEVKQSAIETVAFSDPATVEKLFQTREIAPEPAESAPRTEVWNEPRGQTVSASAPPQKQKSKALIFLAIILPALLASGALVAGGWFYFQNQKKVAQNQSSTGDADETLPANTTVISGQSVLENPSPAENETAAETNPASDAVKKEISALVESWKKATEARNLADYAGKYAEKVDYYDKAGASAAEVRAEAQKIFAAYDEIEIVLSNLRVAADADQTRATAVFDKEWSYESGANLTEGKAHTKLHFQKINNAWKIVGERNVKIYYIEE